LLRKVEHLCQGLYGNKKYVRLFYKMKLSVRFNMQIMLSKEKSKNLFYVAVYSKGNKRTSVLPKYKSTERIFTCIQDQRVLQLKKQNKVFFFLGEKRFVSINRSLLCCFKNKGEEKYGEVRAITKQPCSPLSLFLSLTIYSVYLALTSVSDSGSGDDVVESCWISRHSSFSNSAYPGQRIRLDSEL
jgi:hypothetical protein